MGSVARAVRPPTLDFPTLIRHYQESHRVVHEADAVLERERAVCFSRLSSNLLKTFRRVEYTVCVHADERRHEQ